LLNFPLFIILSAVAFGYQISCGEFMGASVIFVFFFIAITVIKNKDKIPPEIKDSL
jgi:hypothetical protein